MSVLQFRGCCYEISYSFSPVHLTFLFPSLIKRLIIIDVDQIAHDVVDSTKLHQYGPESAYFDIVRIFGKDILLQPDASAQHLPQIDRKKLGDIIFRDPTKRRILNKLTHPRIIRCMLKRIAVEHFIHPNNVVVVDIPLLFEAGYMMQLLFGYIVVVATKPDVQLKRLQLRNPELSVEQCQHRINSQYSIDVKVSKADAVIWNNQSIGELDQNVNKVQDDILELYTNWSRSRIGGCVMFAWLYSAVLILHTAQL